MRAFDKIKYTCDLAYNVLSGPQFPHLDFLFVDDSGLEGCFLSNSNPSSSEGTLQLLFQSSLSWDYWVS